jgi:hypothetical protein
MQRARSATVAGSTGRERSSRSSEPRYWIRWPMRTSARSLQISGLRFSCGTSRRRRRSGRCKRPRSRNGGRSSRRQTSKGSDPPVGHSINPDPRGYDTLLHRTVFFRPWTGLGQSETPNHVSDGGSSRRKRPWRPHAPAPASRFRPQQSPASFPTAQPTRYGPVRGQSASPWPVPAADWHFREQ